MQLGFLFDFEFQGEKRNLEFKNCMQRYDLK